ncbi:hypothetical protein NQ318_023462 [Aromia moschata]|uniref:Trehalase n=1 Tax=Aromia moschata TaxID=1265417 RepID=A0AAV8YJP5_9CUCU|nr:hypothetical protein NQ318_023462 [Aromia moschata]
MFDNFMKGFPNGKPNARAVKKFIADAFEGPGQEFEDWKPTDWIAYPKFLNDIKDKELRVWAQKLNDIWHQLGRKIKQEIRNSDRYSIIWVPNPTIVPGGRFREFYYWDSDWIVKALLLCEMHSTVKGMLENFLYMVDNYGLIPNGGRIYYLARSQPPLLIPMIKLYYEFTGDKSFIARNIHLIEKEFNYWMTNHSKKIVMNGAEYTLAAYGDYSNGPRPESYFEDVTNAHIFTTDDEKTQFYSQLKAAAESGWDFSSRWFVTKGGTSNFGTMKSTKTRFILPVDLNAMLCGNAKIIADFYSLLSNTPQASKYNEIRAQWLRAVTNILWHEDVGAWLDYDYVNKIRRNYFFPTNISPLWTGCYDSISKVKIVNSVLRYLKSRNFLHTGGVPTSFLRTGEQWDFPNAWSPLQHMMIVGLNNTGNKEAMDLAYKLATVWIQTNYEVFKETSAMFEKYDASHHGSSGHGGEYEVQLGFGWTNGVILDLLNRYGYENHSGCWSSYKDFSNKCCNL